MTAPHCYEQVRVMQGKAVYSMLKNIVELQIIISLFLLKRYYLMLLSRRYYRLSMVGWINWHGNMEVNA